MTEPAWIRFDASTNIPDDTHRVDIIDARRCDTPPLITREGFQLLNSPTKVQDFRDQQEVEAVYYDEMCALVAGLTGADCVMAVNRGTLVRFSERSPLALGANTAPPARMAHSDVTERFAAQFAADSPPLQDRPVRRAAQHNIWRTFSAPPQDVPLAVCDARSVSPDDLIVADFRSGAPRSDDGPEFEVLFARYNPAHRWHYYANMTRDEALVFKRFDTDPSQPRCVQHTAFTHPHAKPNWEPRASIEFRTIAYWYE